MAKTSTLATINATHGITQDIDLRYADGYGVWVANEYNNAHITDNSVLNRSDIAARDAIVL